MVPRIKRIYNTTQR